VLPQLAKFKGAALDVFFPQRCLGCGEEGQLLCHACWKSLSPILPPLCRRCGRPQSSDILCSSCISWKASIDGIRSPLRFEGIAREAVHQLKYNNLRSIAKPLATILRDYLLNNPLPVEVLVPVPLHSKRLRERGYNQSNLLSKELGKLLNLPVVNSCLARLKFTQTQAQSKTAEERHHNVNQAFTCLDSQLKDKTVLLIDDVATSGATLDACAIAAKSAGAKTVWGLTLAREI
jgi:ComF family protein